MNIQHARTRHISAEKGTLIGDSLKFLDWLLGYETTRFKQFLKQHGEEQVTSLQVSRVPISSTIRYLFNIITLGYFEEAQKKLGYDNFFHLSIVVNGKYRIEKNETVNQKPFVKDAKEELVDLKAGGFTIDDFIKEGSAAHPKEFWGEYDALGNNCQAWVTMMLRGNGLYDQTIGRFVNQDVKALAKELPGYTGSVTKGVTDFASIVNRVLQLTTGGVLGFKSGGMVGDGVGSLNGRKLRKRVPGPKVKTFGM
jgi:hypothetical protein